MFSVVEFTLTKEVEAVPKSWLTKDGMCWWPNYRKSTSIFEAVKKCETPSEDTYQCYPVRVLHHYSTYEIATAKLKQAQIDSELSSEVDYEDTPKSSLGRPRRRRRQLSLNASKEQDSEDDDGTLSPPISSVGYKAGASQAKRRKREETNTGLPTPPAVPTSSNDYLGNQPSHVLGLVGEARDQGIHQNFTSGALMESVPNSSDQNDTAKGAEVPTVAETPSGNFQTWVVRNINLMKAQLNQVQASMDVIVRNSLASASIPVPSIQVDDFDGILPISSAEQLNMLFDLINKEGNRQLLVSKLSSRGGRNISDYVRRILKRLLSDEVAMTLSWIGSRGGKGSFKASVLPEIIYDAVKLNIKTAAVKEMEDVIKDWLRNAKKRVDKATEQLRKKGEMLASRTSSQDNVDAIGDH